MNAAFIETTSDSTTLSVHQARRKVFGKMPAYPYHELFGINAYSSDIRKAYSSNGSFGLLSAMGHGNPDAFEGQAAGHIFDLRDSASINFTSKEAIVHLYSCNCAQQLGPHLVRSGAKAFIGYRQPVEVPNNSDLLEEFVKVSAVIDRSILGSDSAGTTKSKADTEYSAVEARLRASALVTPRILASFRMNHRALVGPWAGSTYGYF